MFELHGNIHTTSRTSGAIERFERAQRSNIRLGETQDEKKINSFSSTYGMFGQETKLVPSINRKRT